MDNKLFQRKNFASRKFILENNYLKIENKNWRDEKSWQVRLDQIGNQKYYVKESVKPKIGALIVFVGILLICDTIAFLHYLNGVHEDWRKLAIGNIGMLFFTFFFYFKKVNNEISIIGGQQNIAFFRDDPDAETVEKYVDFIIAKSNEYILKQYGKIDPDMPEANQMATLLWLKNRELISDEKYEEMKHEYKMKKLL